MIRIAHIAPRGFALGQSGAPACAPGWFAAVTCTGTLKTETNAQGCSRCVPKTAADDSSEYCIRALQYFLAQQGSVSVAAATGSWNPETENALRYRVGANWGSYAGGACGILASLQAGQIIGGGPFAPSVPGVTTPYTPGNPSGLPPGVSSLLPASLSSMFGGASTTTLLLGAAAIAFAIFMAKR